MNDQQVIFSMSRVGRIYPPNKQVLRDISLGFFYGAKIGVLGLNGAGKSTLLHIISGDDRDFIGELAFTKGYSVGLLEQEPKLDLHKTVKQVVQEAVQPIINLIHEYEEINSKFSDPNADFDALISQQTSIQEKLDKLDAWTLDNRLEVAMDALRCPPEDTLVSVISGGERRRVALCRLLLTEPDILLLDEPTSHLDLHHQVGLLELVRTLAHHDGLAVLIALHDLNLAARYADRIALMVDGRVKSLGTPNEVLRPELISEAYHLPVQVIPNPLDGSPLVLPNSSQK